MAHHFQSNDGTIAADPRIYNNNVHRVFREISVARLNEVGSFNQVLWIDGVGNINNLGGRIDGKDDSLHNPYIGIFRTKIRQQCDCRHDEAIFNPFRLNSSRV